MNLTMLSILLYAGAYLLLFLTWAGVVFYKVQGAENLVQYIQVTLGSLTGHVLTLIYPHRATGAPPISPPSSGSQSGFARWGLLVILAMVSAVTVTMAGCSLLPSNLSQIEEGAAQTVVQSSERTICRDIPIGTWMRLYGASAERVKGWQSLCFNPVTAPLNDATVAAILKVYPTFQQAIDAGTSLPAPTLPPTSKPLPSSGGTQ